MSDTTMSTDEAFGEWLRASARRGSTRAFTTTGDAATDIQWLRRSAGLVVEPGPDVDGRQGASS